MGRERDEEGSKEEEEMKEREEDGEVKITSRYKNSLTKSKQIRCEK